MIIRWDGTDGALVAPSAPGLTTELCRLRFGTDSHMDDIPATARLSDVQTSSVRLFAMDVAVDGIDAVPVDTFYSPATALSGVPSLSVTDGRFTQGGLYGDDVTVTDSVLDFVTVIGEHTITLERTRGSDLRVWMRNDRSDPRHLVTMREVTMNGGEVRSPFDPASSWNLPIAWDARGSVFVGVVWGWLSDASSTGDADPHEIAPASTFSGNVFAHHRGWFRITGADAVFTNNAFTDPTFSAAMTPHNRATLTLATDASATVRHNSFLGYDPALGHRTLGLDTNYGLAAEREPYGAGLDATENFLDTTDATTVQGLLHDRTDDPATFGNYIRVTPLLTSPHADTPDPAPWR